MHFALTLHSHLPYVLNHGRWPHGSDWLCEAALDTYLPLVAELRTLEEEGVPAPLTLGITPVLANQLADPLFAEELETFLEQRIRMCDDAPASLASTGDLHLLPLVAFWRSRYEWLRALFREVEGDLAVAFRDLEEAGRLELVTSAASHALLPLLGRDESIRLQLALGTHEHRRIFGRSPRGCWIPECAYRPAGWWDPLPGTSAARDRGGLDEHLRSAGFSYVFLDTHLAGAGDPLGAYGDVPQGAERSDVTLEGPERLHAEPSSRSPHTAFRLGDASAHPPLVAFVREPRSSLQVWSRHHGYPGDEWYLEFHKIRWPGGLKMWRVTDSGADLGSKQPYDPLRALQRSREHATHFAWLLEQIQREERVGSLGVAMVPFDTELFGHWWFEGIPFLSALFRETRDTAEVAPLTASQHLEAAPPGPILQPREGSWGAGGDFSMWLNEGTQWSWKTMWRLEERFWTRAPAALNDPLRRPILAAAARQLVLAQSSDWQFMISTGAVPDYGERRFRLHAGEADALLDALEPDAEPDTMERGARRILELRERDRLFPDIIDVLTEVLAQTPAH